MGTGEPPGTGDRCRPTYHYSSGGWMNDVIPYWDGRTLHVYFNHHKEPRWGRFRWGHARTDDLVSWATAPFAIVPTRDGPDQGGVWSGSVVDTPEGAAALYTGIPTYDPLTQVQCLARSTDGGVTWAKHPEPVLTAPPDGFGDCWRDPFAWWDGDRWRLLVGSARRDEKVAAVLAYESRDLVRWRYAGPLYVARDGGLRHEAECPELFPLAGRHVLATSSGVTRGLAGELAGDGTFRPDGPPVTFDPGASYAARSVDAGGRRVQLAWLTDARSRDATEAAGWAGALSLPRELRLGGDGRPAVAPVAELARLRVEQLHDGPVAPGPVGAAGGRRLVPGCRGLALELDVRLDPVPGGTASVVVACDPAGDGGVEVGVDWAAGTVAGHRLGPLPPGQPVRLRVYLDASVVEAFALGRVVTLRSYDLPADPRVAVRSAAAAEVAAWRLAPPPGSHPVGTPGVVTT